MDKAEVVQNAALAGAFYLIEKDGEVYFYTANNRSREVSTIWYAPTPDAKPEKVIRFTTQREALRYLKDLERTEGFSHVKATNIKQFFMRNSKLLVNLYLIFGSLGLGTYLGLGSIRPASSPRSFHSSGEDPLSPFLESVFGEEFIERKQRSEQMNEGIGSFFRRFIKRPRSQHSMMSSSLPDPSNNVSQLRDIITSNFNAIVPMNASLTSKNLQQHGIRIGASPEMSEKMMIKIIVLYMKGNDVSSYKNKMEVVYRDMAAAMNDIPMDDDDAVEYFEYLMSLADQAMGAIDLSTQGKSYQEIQ